jgi:hypothetical protein
MQLLVEVEQPTQAKLVGLPVQVAVNVMLVPATGNALLVASVHDTPVDVACQSMFKAVTTLVLLPLLADTE